MIYSPYAKRRVTYVNDTAPQSALREWRTHMAHPLRLACLLGIAVMLAIAGPFNTDEVMAVVPRLGYWLTVVLLCYSAGFGASKLTERVFGSPVAGPKAMAFDAVVTAAFILAIIYLLNGLLFSYWATGRELAILGANVVVISFIISALFVVAERHNAEEADAPAAPPPLLDRLPLDKRGALVSLSVEDHYVRIRTTKGEDMVLLRLSDAMREVGATQGLQVHRSHWISVSKVTAAARKGDGALLTMSNGPQIPVSRANVAKIKEAGLLPS